MNLRVYGLNDVLKGSIFYMSVAETDKELDEIFAEALEELLVYYIELKKNTKTGDREI